MITRQFMDSAQRMLSPVKDDSLLLYTKGTRVGMESIYTGDVFTEKPSKCY